MPNEGCHWLANDCESSSCFVNVKTESQEKDTFSCNQSTNEGSVKESVDDWIVQEGDKEFYKNLNSIILQVLKPLDKAVLSF